MTTPDTRHGEQHAGLYQTHGDHIEAVMPTETFTRDHMTDIVNDSEVWREAYTVATTESLRHEWTLATALRHGEGAMSWLSLAAYDSKGSARELVTVYPMLEGAARRVTIESVEEWDDGIEATVHAAIGDFRFAFFAIDYYVNKPLYVTGRTTDVDLAALGLRVEASERGFSFEGQQAIDWLAKTGREPELDSEGRVKPVNFSLEQLVAYLATDDRCPDEAQFQSPAGETDAARLSGIDFTRADITVCRDEDSETATTVPLYFRRDMLPEAKAGDPIRGWLWMTGSLTGEHGQQGRHDSTLAQMCDTFQRHMNSIDYHHLDDLSSAQELLPLLRVREGYVLDAYEMGEDGCSLFMAYCRRKDATEQYLPTITEKRSPLSRLLCRKPKERHVPYDDARRIDGRLGWLDVEDIPQALPYFEAPFTEEGIMQAWHVSRLADFMPHRGTAFHRSRHFIFSRENLCHALRCCDRETPEGRKALAALLSTDPDTLLPRVDIDGDTALVHYAYWCSWEGLILCADRATRCGEHITFKCMEEKTLMKYDCGIRIIR